MISQSSQRTILAFIKAAAVGMPLLCIGPAQGAAGLTTTFTILSINARDIGTDVYTSGFTSPFPCVNSDVVRIYNSESNGDMLRATALTAYTTGRPVKAYINACAGDGISIAVNIWAL